MKLTDEQKLWYQESVEDFDSKVSPKSFRKPTRVWPKAGYSKELIFVDELGFSIWEHSYSVNGDSRNWITCLEQAGESCPFCNRNIKRFFNTLYTVIETSGHWGGNDIWYQNKRRIFCIQPDVARVVAKNKRRLENTIVGKKFKIERGDYSAVATEHCFKYIESVDLEKYNNPHPFDYRRIFAPLSTRELETILKQNNEEKRR